MSAVEMPAAGDVPYVPEVWDGPLMSDVLRGVEYHGQLCVLGL